MTNRITLKLLAILGKPRLDRWQVRTAIILLPMLLALSDSSSVSAEKTRFFPHKHTLSGVSLSPQILAQKERRTALVIGNGAYSEGKLNNPPNDAVDVSQALKNLGFEVTLLQNVDKRKIEESINQFNRQLRNGGVGVFYFAGHGVQVDGENYLIPIGAMIDRKSDVAYEAIPLGRVLGAMEDAGNPINLVLIDACRNNPYSLGFRSSSRGLAPVQSAQGTLISFATAPGKVAADGGGRNSPYAASLLQYIQVPGLPVEQMFKRMRQAVLEKTGGKQSPWEQNNLVGDFAFQSTKTVPPTPSPRSTPLPLPSPDSSPIAVSSQPSVPRPTAPIPLTGNSSTTTFSQSNEGIVFQLRSCRSESANIKCEFLVIDQTENRELYIYGNYRDKSKIIDTQGNEYVAKRVNFGSAVNTAYVGQNLAQGIGLTILLTFEKVPIQVNQLALVKISAHTKSQGYFTVQFRDIPVSN